MSLRIDEGLSVILEEWLATGKIDIAIITAIEDSKLLNTQFVAKEEMMLISPSQGTCNKIGDKLRPGISQYKIRHLVSCCLPASAS